MAIQKIISTGVSIAKSSVNRVLNKPTNAAASAVEIKEAVYGNLHMADPVIRDYVNKMKITPSDGIVFKAFHEISVKLEGVKDEVIKKVIYHTIEQAKSENKYPSPIILFELLDTYHTVNGKYSMLGGDVQSFFKYLKTEVDPKQAKKISGNEGLVGKFFSKIFPQSAKNIEYRESFERAKKLEALKNFCLKNGAQKPELTNYLYETYYLSRLTPETCTACRKVLDKFGTKLFLENEQSDKAAKAVYKELEEWKKAGGKDALFPQIIDFSRIHQSYIDRESRGGGGIYFFNNDKSASRIVINNDSLESVLFALRHEMAHLNDKKIIKDNKMLKGKFRRRYDGDPYAFSLRKAGVKNTGYAHVNKLEFVAKAAEGDYSQYSDYFKKFLTRLGLPEWVFKMKPIKDMDYFG